MKSYARCIGKLLGIGWKVSRGISGIGAHKTQSGTPSALDDRTQPALVPIRLFRTAVFKPIKDEDRTYNWSMPLVGEPDAVGIYYHGEDLNHEDLEVWDGIMRRAVDDAFEIFRVASFSGPEFLSRLPLAVTEKNLKWLGNCIWRLRMSGLETRLCSEEGEEHWAQSRVRLPLLEHVFEYEPTQTWVVCLDAMFHERNLEFAHLQWTERRHLRKNPLASWLYHYFSINEDISEIDVQTLKSLAGSGTAQTREFKEELGEAIQHLTRSGAHFLKEGEIGRDDKIRIVRFPKSDTVPRGWRRSAEPSPFARRMPSP